jgi:Fe-S-cluster containining protein
VNERPAGDFSVWLSEMHGALRGHHAADVPCAGCTACCTASQFVHIDPDETDTLAHIPRAVMFPAPQRPPGHMVMGYDEHGHCPMLVDGACSVYEHRPRACRTYDCRIYAATGITPDDPGVAERVASWRFTENDDTHERLAAHAATLPIPAPTARAVAAVRTFE